MPSPVLGLFSIVLHGTAATFKDPIEAAVRRVFPQAVILERSESAESSPTNAPSTRSGSLLVVCDPDAAALTQAQNEQDETGLPRWGVIVIAGPDACTELPHPVDSLSHQDLNTPLLTYVLRSAWERLQLRRTNQRLRGYLMTYGSRIAHDLRTPLGGILTTTEMLREILTEDAPADVPLIQPILDSTDGLVKLIERSSFFARASSAVDSGGVVDMAMPFWSAYQQVERLIIKKRVEFLHPPGWPKVIGHESWLEIVWRILLHNAIDHSKEGSRVTAGWTGTDGDVRFWIRSEGHVVPEKRASLFFPFQRLHEPGAPRGLGLPMMRALIELDGGSCGFEAPATGGVEFFFILPALTGVDSTADPGRADH